MGGGTARAWAINAVALTPAWSAAIDNTSFCEFLQLVAN